MICELYDVGFGRDDELVDCVPSLFTDDEPLTWPVEFVDDDDDDDCWR